MAIILHMDLDAFFASCEQKENPELEGKPVIVGADPKEGKGRGIVCTCSYEARKYGIRSGMPISRAYRLCPDGVFIRPNFSLYSYNSRRIMEIAEKYADVFKQVSVDEACLDVSSAKTFPEAGRLAARLAAEIERSTGLTCSIGVGSNKLIAKIASDYMKPKGITVVRKGNEMDFLSPMPVRNLLGVGEKTEASLKELGFLRIGDIAKADIGFMKKRFGKWGVCLVKKARGIGGTTIERYREAKSISKEVTFDVDVKDGQIVSLALKELAHHVHSKLQSKDMVCRTIGIKVRYEDFDTKTCELSLKIPTDRLNIIREVQRNLLKDFLNDGRKVRLVGARVSNLQKAMQARQMAIADFA